MKKENLHNNSIVSIIVPTLNAETSIKDLLVSAYGQTYRPLELILVDGGSTDRTLKIVTDFARKLKNDSFEIHVFHESNFGKNRSPANGRNIGVKMARGSHLIIIDADTFLIKKDSIEKIKKNLDKYDLTSVETEIAIDTELERQIALTYSKEYNCGFRKSVFKHVQFDTRLGYGEDREFWYKIQKTLNVSFEVKCDTVLGRHLPHTRAEYLHQTVWYARTYPVYIQTIHKYNKYPEIEEICRVLASAVIALNSLLFFAFSLAIDMACPERSVSRLKFAFFNFFRRYLFLFYFVKESIARRIFHIYGRILANYFRFLTRL